jgi:hypothetical protein
MQRRRTPKDGERYISYGVYVGPELPLRGYLAILQRHPKRWKLCLAQFDDMTLRTDGSHNDPEKYPKITVIENYLGFGQHEFRRKDFKSVSMSAFFPPPKLPVRVTRTQSGAMHIRIGR